MIRSVLYFQDYSSININKENSHEDKENTTLENIRGSVTGLCGFNDNRLFHLIEDDMAYVDELIAKEDSKKFSPAVELIFDQRLGRRFFSNWQLYQPNQKRIRDTGFDNFLMANFDHMHTLSDKKFEALSNFINHFFE